MILLCSSSPTRAKILKKFNIEFKQVKIDFNEDSINFTAPRAFVYNVVKGKLADAVNRYGLENKLLVADSVVVVNGKIVRKAKSKQEAKELLLMQSGNEASIMSCAALKGADFTFWDLSETKYIFNKFDEDDLQKYLDSGLWRGKAGACMVEGFCKKYIKKVVGLESTAMGLQIEKIIPWLEFGK